MADRRVYDWFMKSPTPTRNRQIYIGPDQHAALRVYAAERQIKLSAAANLAVSALLAKATRKAAAK